MNVAFVVRNDGSDKFVMTDGLDLQSSFCVYNTVTGKVAWTRMPEQQTSNFALSLFNLGISRVVSTGLESYMLQKINQNEIPVLQAVGSDLIENIKLYNKQMLHDMSSPERASFKYVRRAGNFFESSLA